MTVDSSLNAIAISIQKLFVEYGETERARYALHDVSCDLAKGSWTSIVGANGSGKSTLAKVIAGLCEPSDGMIIRATDSRVHIVLQNPETQILGDTLYEEIKLSLREPIRVSSENNAEENATQNSDQNTPQNSDQRLWVRSILDEVGLSLALDTPTSRLSGGEKQLLNIAVSVAAGANVFVLDEVTSMLDYASRDLVIEVIQKLNHKGATIVWCTHRSEEISYSGQVILLDKGCVSYKGSSRQFLYGDSHITATTSPCEQWGMELPYVVQVVKQLETKGYSLHEQPLLPHELREAIEFRCR